MKMTKFFAAIFAFAAVAFTACEPQPQGPIVPPVDTTEQVVDLVIPTVAKPAAGQTTVVLYVPADTPKGCYAVGSFNWDATNTEKMFTAVSGAQEGWVALTLDWTEGLEFKVLAIPSDESVQPGWSYQWGKNCDPENDLDEDNVVILQGAGEFVLENQGQPKLTKLADGDVTYIHVKAWATTPIIEAKPCETAAFKHPFGGGDWVYREATKTAEATFELNALYGNTGVNVALNTNADGENWYPEDQITFVAPEGETVAQGDSVNFKFVSEKGTVGKVTVTLIQKGTATPEEKNEAGEATFTLKANNLPEGYEIGVVGVLEVAEWDITKAVLMTKKDSVYTVTTGVKAACEYKYFVRKVGGEWSWDFGEDGGNRKMPLDLKPVDTVDAWKLPAAQ